MAKGNANEPASPTAPPPLISVQNLSLTGRRGRGPETPIVTNVSFNVAEGEMLALIGESGSGKTSIALALTGYARQGCRIQAALYVWPGTMCCT